MKPLYIAWGLIIILSSFASSILIIFQNRKKIEKKGILYIIHQSIIYLALIFFIALIFVIILIFKQSGLVFVSTKNEIITIYIISFIVIVIMKSLENFLSTVIEKIGHGKENIYQFYDYQKTLRDASRAIASTLEHDKILSLIKGLLDKTIGIDRVSLIKYNKEKYIYNEIEKKENRLVLNINHPLIRLLKKIQTPILIKNITMWQIDKTKQKDLNLIDPSSDLAVIKRELQNHNFVGTFPLISKQQLVGILAIGKKKSQNPYNSDDLRLLSTLAHQTATAIENANLYLDIKQTELAIREQRDKVQSIITNLSDGLVVIDKNKKIIMINPVAEKLFPNKRLMEEPLPKILDQGINEENISKIQFPLISEVNIDTKIIRIISAPLFDEKEGRTGYIKILHDITRDKEIDKIKSDFIRTAAHRLRTPLSAVKWIFQMLIDGDLGNLEKQQKEFLEKGYQSNERMIRVVNDLLNVSEIEEGKFGFRFEKIQIADIIKDVIKKLDSLIKEKEQKLSYYQDKKIPLVNCDPYKIRIAIMALILNSIQYTPKGGKINIKLENLTREIKFTITDKGLGIPTYQQHKLFTKFMRGDNIIEIETEGNGLGLYITKNIINGHGGRIDFKSEENKGSTFYFTIPVKRND